MADEFPLNSRPAASPQRAVRAVAGAVILAMCLLTPLATRAGSVPAPAGWHGPDAVAPPHADTQGVLAGKLDPAVRAAVAAAKDDPLSVFLVTRPVDAPGFNLEAGPWQAPARRAASVATLRARHSATAGALFSAAQAAVSRGAALEAVDLWLVSAVAVTAPADTILALAARPDVARVGLDYAWPAPEPLESTAATPDLPLWNLSDVRAPDAWNLLGVDGSGVTVAVLDTGVDFHHPGLSESYRGYDGRRPPDNPGNWWCPAALCGSGNRYPFDNAGHGTHVLGTILGRDTGVAPGARWVAAMVCTAEVCQDRWIIEALQWLIDRPATETDAPRIVNLSLEKRGTAVDIEMKAAVDAVVQAGVIAVVASGNYSHVYSPGTFTSTIAVGAVDDQKRIPIWSGRGLSPWFEPKPEVVAPGVGVLSTVPGGGLGASNGTSMASPHVAGVAALMLQADTALTPGRVKAVLKDTSTRLAPGIPDGGSGWGLVNAYGAVAHLSAAGTLAGRVTAAASVPPQPPRWGAHVEVRRPDLAPVVGRAVDATGHYTLAVQAGDYLVTAGAFGFISRTVAVSLAESEFQAVDFALEAVSDGGYLVGRINAADGRPVTGRVLLEGTPVIRPFEDGYMALEGIPPGAYSLRIEATGFRIHREALTVAPNAVTQFAVTLDAAPRILLVDGDAWRFTGAVHFYRDALSRLGFLYDLHRVLDAQNPVLPTPGDLAAYDVVIWSQDFSSPGYIRAHGLLTQFLDAGGRLFLAGQDVVCGDWGPPCTAPERRRAYVRDRLFVELVRDITQSRLILGTGPGPFDGLSVPLNGDGSLGNHYAPDVLAVADETRAEVVAAYDDGGGAAVLVNRCVPYRALVTGFGLEGVTGDAPRDAFLSAAILALQGDVSPRLHLNVEPAGHVVRPGTTARYTVTLLSAHTEAVDVAIGVSGNAWPAALYRLGFSEPLPGGLVQALPCTAARFGLEVRVPADARGAAQDVLYVEATSALGLHAALPIETRTAAPVLLVDGDTWLQSENHYRTALDSLGVPYDVWKAVPDPTTSAFPKAPPEAFLADHPITIWFNGYNPHASGHLSLDHMNMLARYLEGGGRLLFSSEDYLNYRGWTYFRGQSLFHREFLGVGHYDQDRGVRSMSGLAATPYADIQGCRVRPSGETPDDSYADHVRPRSDPRAMAILAEDGRPGSAVATRYYSGTFKSTFFAFDLAKLEARCATEVLARTLDWFHPLNLTSIEVDRPVYAGGDTVPIAVRLLNDGPNRLARASVTWRLPPGGTPADVPPGWTWDPASRSLQWSGNLEQARPVAASVDFVLNADLPRGALLESVLTIDDHTGLPLERRTSWRVNMADLSASSKSAAVTGAVDHGDRVRFTIALRNRGSLPAGTFVVTDTLPAGLVLLERTVTHQPGTTLVDLNERRVIWRGALPAGGEASLSFDAEVTTRWGGVITNVALLDDGEAVIELRRSVNVRSRLHLPWTSNQGLLPRR